MLERVWVRVRGEIVCVRSCVRVCVCDLQPFFCVLRVEFIQDSLPYKYYNYYYYWISQCADFKYIVCMCVGPEVISFKKKRKRKKNENFVSSSGLMPFG